MNIYTNEEKQKPTKNSPETSFKCKTIQNIKENLYDVEFGVEL